MANHFNILTLRTPWAVWKGKKIWHWKINSPGWVGAQYATGKQWRNSSRKNEEIEPKQKTNKKNKQTKNHPVVDMTGDGNKVQCCKEQYCLGTWNVRSMNQGKLEMAKQVMARVNIDILLISEPNWTGMGELNSNDHYIYYCGQESLRRYAVALIGNKKVWNAVLGYNLKNDRMISVCFQRKPFNITVMLKKLKLNGSMKTYKTS